MLRSKNTIKMSLLYFATISKTTSSTEIIRINSDDGFINQTKEGELVLN